MSEGREYELKFALKHGAVEHLFAHRLLRDAAKRRETRHLVSTYFDTPDDTLRGKRLALRVRTSNSAVVQTLKGAGRSMVDRDEWEHEGGGPRPDVSWLRSTPHGGVFADGIVDALQPRFTIDVSRIVLPISVKGAEIEGALDEGVIRSSGLSLKLREFELELKDGSGEKVLAFARRLVRDVPLTLCLPTKSERGYSVIDGTWNAPTRAIPIDLSATKTVGEAFSAVVQGCLHAIYRNAAMIGGTENDEDAIHKTRIAIRHLRAALTLFRPALRRRRFARLNAGVKWMSDKLGAARDADVFQHDIFDKAAEKNDPEDAVLVADRMRELQREAHDALHVSLKSKRWRLLLFDLLVFSIDGVRRRTREKHAAPFVRARLSKQRRDLAQATRGWSALSIEEIHDVRKRAKVLRYALDLLDTLPKLGAKRGKMRALNDDLQKLQEKLGVYHDGLAMRQRLGEAILRRNAPRGADQHVWQRVQKVARRLAGSFPQNNKLLAKAHKAARRLRKNNAF